MKEKERPEESSIGKSGYGIYGYAVGGKDEPLSESDRFFGKMCSMKEASREEYVAEFRRSFGEDAGFFIELYDETPTSKRSGRFDVDFFLHVHELKKLFSPTVKKKENELRQRSRGIGVVFPPNANFEKLQNNLRDFAGRMVEETIIGGKKELFSRFYDIDVALPYDSLITQRRVGDHLSRLQSLKIMIQYLKMYMDCEKFDLELGRKYIAGVDEIFQIDKDIGIKCGLAATYLVYKRETKIMEEYFRAIKFLLGKYRIKGDSNFKPSDLLAKMIVDIGAVEGGLDSDVFKNYLYEGRLPAYSWSASSGEEMMRALTTGDYRKSYEVERRLIKRVNRDISERYG